MYKVGFFKILKKCYDCYDFNNILRRRVVTWLRISRYYKDKALKFVYYAICFLQNYAFLLIL